MFFERYNKISNVKNMEYTILFRLEMYVTYMSHICHMLYRHYMCFIFILELGIVQNVNFQSGFSKKKNWFKICLSRNPICVDLVSTYIIYAFGL